MRSRRQFVTSTLAAGVALASQKATAQAAKRTIVNSQVHLWKAESEDWKWVPGMKPQLPEPFTIEKLVPLMDEAGVNQVVVVPPSWPGDRNDYALEAAKRYPDRFRVMGRIPLKDPKSAEMLPKWKQQKGMLGVRLTFLGPAAAWLTDGTADWFWPAAEKARLPVMFLAPGRSAEFGKTAERHPRLTLIVDHMSVLGDIVKPANSRKRSIRTVALAKFPNVSVKLSAAPNFSGEPYPFHDFDMLQSNGCLTLTDRNAAIGEPILLTATTRLPINSASPILQEELKFLSEKDKDWVMGKSILERLNWA